MIFGGFSTVGFLLKSDELFGIAFDKLDDDVDETSGAVFMTLMMIFFSKKNT
jgi:hypothetical protein